jgi:hypothetical protein
VIRVWVPNVGDVAIGESLTEAVHFLEHGTDEERVAAATWLSCETDPRALSPLDRSIDAPGAVGIIARDALGLTDERPDESIPVMFARGQARKGVALERAIRDAKTMGREPFDWDAFRAAGCRPHGLAEHRFDYYVMRSEYRTMAEYIAHRKEREPWE